jgi:hypothetical protein
MKELWLRFQRRLQGEATLRPFSITLAPRLSFSLAPFHPVPSLTPRFLSVSLPPQRCHGYRSPDFLDSMSSRRLKSLRLKLTTRAAASPQSPEWATVTSHTRVWPAGQHEAVLRPRGTRNEPNGAVFGAADSRPFRNLKLI